MSKEVLGMHFNCGLYQCVFVGNPFKFFVLSCIQFPQMIWIENLWEDILPDENHKEERHWEQDPCYRYPCYAKAYQQVNKLEDREARYCFWRDRLHKRCMRTFQNPAEVTIKHRLTASNLAIDICSKLCDSSLWKHMLPLYPC
jgi:hypothetical protein